MRGTTLHTVLRFVCGVEMYRGGSTPLQAKLYGRSATPLEVIIRWYLFEIRKHELIQRLEPVTFTA